ncbi:aminotransferase class IV [Saccharibacillus sp. JS10]|uniref:aminotransferase class IV n=1 Tax=Saccharibacillus sp. JS10 TaxID=2950552 RepID=UPI00210E4042|nr:aminotransferase class IV [Saccharibacillus sp. JS10]MCQ4088976.1 aminotransferase class IV [Saccharibacillus sp. JS10]
MSIIGLNGQLIAQHKASLSVMDHGLMYGIGLFETFRTYGGKPFLLDRHLQRMERGAQQLGITWNLKQSELEKEISSLLSANELTEAYIRLTLTAGEDDLGLPSSSVYSSPNRIVYIKGLPNSPTHWYTEGRTLQRLLTPRNTPEGVERLKSLHYMNGILGRRELGEIPGAQGAEGMMLTREGFLAEGIVSNLFFVQSGKLCTPSVDTGILPGITRAFVQELATELNLNTQEGHYTWEDLVRADEVFLTGSVQGIVPVRLLREVDGSEHVVGAGTPGLWTTKLIERYHHYTKETRNST